MPSRPLPTRVGRGIATAARGRLSPPCGRWVAGGALLLLACLPIRGRGEEAATRHPLFSSHMPAGAIGGLLLQQGQLPGGRVQPVKFFAPDGTVIAPVVGGQFDLELPAPATLGLTVGYAYRFRVSRIPRLEGVELYPSVELIGHLHPPPGLALKFPVPVELTPQELALAAAGHFITRVIYVEDPATALPVSESPGDPQQFFEVPLGDDPLHAADRLGRPVAILRIGSRYPLQEPPEPDFVFHSPPVRLYSQVQELSSPTAALPTRATP